MRQTDARAIMDSGLDGVELAVALALWSFADDSGRCWPALRSLCRRSGWRERAVQRSLRALEAAGVLTVHHVPGRVTPTYVLRLAELPACADAAGESDAPADVVEEGCTTDTPGARETPPVSVVHPPVHVVHPPVSIRHPPVSVVHPNPSWNPPENPPSNPPDKSMSAPPPPAGAGQPLLFGGQVEEPVKPRRPSAAERAQAEAAALFERLEALRLTRHKGALGLKPATWTPRCKTALSKYPAQDFIDSMMWTLHDPGAAFLRGEERGGGPDRTVDLSLVLRHPEYALRRSWWGAQAPTPEELAEAEAAHAEGRPPPAWVERRNASPMGRRAAQDAERKRREDDEARAWLRANTGAGLVIDDDDVCF
jgi:hypothetical protein